jgi:hypothetical protein
MKGIKTTILLVIIAILIIYYHLIPEKCYGLIPVGFLWICLLYVIGIILILIIRHKSIKQYRITNRKTAKIPIYIALGLSFIILSVLMLINIRDNSKVLIHAEQRKGSENHFLLLKQNNTFEYSWCYVDIGCTKIGRYKMYRDTIYLSDFIRGDSLMITKFYHKDKWLIPIKDKIMTKDSTKFFKIIK